MGFFVASNGALLIFSCIGLTSEYSADKKKGEGGRGVGFVSLSNLQFIITQQQIKVSKISGMCGQINTHRSLLDRHCLNWMVKISSFQLKY